MVQTLLLQPTTPSSDFEQAKSGVVYSADCTMEGVHCHSAKDGQISRSVTIVTYKCRSSAWMKLKNRQLCCHRVNTTIADTDFHPIAPAGFVAVFGRLFAARQPRPGKRLWKKIIIEYRRLDWSEMPHPVRRFFASARELLSSWNAIVKCRHSAAPRSNHRANYWKGLAMATSKEVCSTGIRTIPDNTL